VLSWVASGSPLALARMLGSGRGSASSPGQAIGVCGPASGSTLVAGGGSSRERGSQAESPPSASLGCLVIVSCRLRRHPRFRAVLGSGRAPRAPPGPRRGAPAAPRIGSPSWAEVRRRRWSRRRNPSLRLAGLSERLLGGARACALVREESEASDNTQRPGLFSGLLASVGTCDGGRPRFADQPTGAPSNVVPGAWSLAGG